MVETTAVRESQGMTRIQASEDNGWLLRLSLQDARVAAVELIVGTDGIDVADDNVDVDIVMVDGSVHHRVFMTPKNASTLLAKWRTTGRVWPRGIPHSCQYGPRSQPFRRRDQSRGDRNARRKRVWKVSIVVAMRHLTGA